MQNMPRNATLNCISTREPFEKSDGFFYAKNFFAHSSYFSALKVEDDFLMHNPLVFLALKVGGGFCTLTIE